MDAKEQRNYLRGQVGLYPMTGFRRQGDGWAVTVEPDAPPADVGTLLRRLRKTLEPAAVNEAKDDRPTPARRPQFTARLDGGRADAGGPRPDGASVPGRP